MVRFAFSCKTVLCASFLVRRQGSYLVQRVSSAALFLLRALSLAGLVFVALVGVVGEYVSIFGFVFFVWHVRASVDRTGARVRGVSLTMVVRMGKDASFSPSRRCLGPAACRVPMLGSRYALVRVSAPGLLSLGSMAQ